MATSTDQKKIDELLTRGVEHVYPSRAFLESRLASGKRLSLYLGIDPTGPTLHMGHVIPLLKLRQFQELGHEIILLIGDFTGMIGDPTDKLATRKQLTKKEVLKNCALYKKQASAVLNFSGINKAEIRYNSAWQKKMTFDKVLELAVHFTVPRLMERDMFQERLKQGGTIHLHEFLYPVMQAYDSVAMNVDGEIGGNDQTFNMLAGRDLMKEVLEKEKFVLTTKLLVDSSGKKMGKTEGNMIALNDTPEDMFGKIMRWSDEMISLGFELCTRMSMDDIASILKADNPRDAKLILAFEVVKIFLGEKAAKKGREHFASVIQSKDAPDEMPDFTPSAYDILTILVEAGFATSKGEARRAIDGGGVRVNKMKVVSYDQTVKKGDVVQKGKRFFVRVL